MHIRSIKRLRDAFFALITAFGFLSVAPTAALAQGSDAEDTLDEVTVTARRREETLKDVPIAVTAFSSDYLEEVGMPDIVGVTQSTPNVTLEVSRATSSTLTAFIRGVGQQDPVAGYEGGVGIYLDDVYLARPQGVVFDIYDVERIEVLRGPQGTLYGRNTIGGAIRYVTKGLSDSGTVKLKGSIGSYNQVDVVGTFALPVTDNLRVGGTIASFTRDGFGDNLFTGGEHYNKEIFAGRFSFEYDAGDDVRIRMSADFSDDKSAPKSGHRLTVGNLSGAPVLGDVFDTRAGIETLASSTGGLIQEVEQSGVHLTVDWAINDVLMLKSITADRKDDSESLIDFDSLPGNDFDAPVLYENEQFSQEFQFTYTGDDISGVFGLYYIDANAFDAFDVVLGNLGVTSFTLGDFDTKSWAVFGDLVWDFTDTMSLAVGGRFTSDERSTTVTRELFLGLGSPYFGNTSAVSLTVPSPGLVPTFTGKRTDEDFTPRVSFSWNPTDEHNLYASISEGFKGGSFDPRGAYQIPGVEQGFEPETVVAYELGAKSTWWDGKASTNIAVFYTDYEDIQVPGSIAIDTDNDGVNDSFAGATTNAGKAEINGVELESMIQFTDTFSAMASLGLIDAEYTEWIVANIQLRKEWDSNLFNKPGSIALIGGASFKEDMFQFEIPNSLLDTEPYTLIDLSLGWKDDEGRYSLSLHGRNLTDEEYKVASYDFPTLGLEGVQSAFYGNPRTITLTGAMNF